MVSCGSRTPKEEEAVDTELACDNKRASYTGDTQEMVTDSNSSPAEPVADDSVSDTSVEYLGANGLPSIEATSSRLPAAKKRTWSLMQSPEWCAIMGVFPLARGVHYRL